MSSHRSSTLTVGCRGDGVTVEVGPGEQVRFDGEAMVAVALDQATRALNVMTSRGRWTAEVTIRPRTEAAAGRSTVSVDLGDRIADLWVTRCLDPGPTPS